MGECKVLNEGYSHCQIQAKTHLGKGTIGRIAKEVEINKENNSGGHPSKLSTCNKTTIIYEICSGWVDTAVQATHLINSTISDPVTSQTVRCVLKKGGFYSATKKKVPLLKKTHWQKRLEFAHYHENWTVEDFKRVLWTDETKIN